MQAQVQALEVKQRALVSFSAPWMSPITPVSRIELWVHAIQVWKIDEFCVLLCVLLLLCTEMLLLIFLYQVLKVAPKSFISVLKSKCCMIFFLQIIIYHYCYIYKALMIQTCLVHTPFSEETNANSTYILRKQLPYISLTTERSNIKPQCGIFKQGLSQGKPITI